MCSCADLWRRIEESLAGLKFPAGIGPQEPLFPSLEKPTWQAADSQDGCPQPDPESAAAPLPKILLVEDNDDNRELLLMQLQFLGYGADYCRNGQEALERLNGCQYDLVLMDCNMPILDGYEATRTWRQQEASQTRTIIVGVTAYAMRGDRDKCLAAGMDDYLSKPVSTDDIERVLNRWLVGL